MFGVADLHTLTSARAKEEGVASTETARMLLACGIDPNRSILYRQSDIGGYHTQLSWVLSCVCPIPLLKRMVAYKDSRMKKRDSLALFSYPVLQAADILLFRATRVPVGEDQRQHLEFARDIVTTFSSLHKTDFFRDPKAEFSQTLRIMSLRDERTKMSKSDPVKRATLFLDDSAEILAEKIQKAKTDSESGITFDEIERPALANLIRMYASFAHLEPLQVAAEFENREKGYFKEKLTELLVSKLSPIRKKSEAISTSDVEEVLAKGATKARIVAEENWNEVAKIVGLRN